MAFDYLSVKLLKRYSEERRLKAAPLLAALANWEKVQQGKAAERLEVLISLGRELQSLRKANKTSPEALKFFAEMEKAHDRALLEAEALLKEEAEDEEKETPALLGRKLIPLVRQVRGGDTMHVMVATTGMKTALLMERRAIASSRRNLLKQYLDISGGVKFLDGTCVFEDNMLTFVLSPLPGAIAKKLKAALLAQTGLRLPVQARAVVAPAR